MIVSACEDIESLVGGIIARGQIGSGASRPSNFRRDVGDGLVRSVVAGRHAERRSGVCVAERDSGARILTTSETYFFAYEDRATKAESGRRSGVIEITVRTRSEVLFRGEASPDACRGWRPAPSFSHAHRCGRPRSSGG